MRVQGYQKKKEVLVREQENVEYNKTTDATKKHREEQRSEGAHPSTHETTHNPNCL